MFNFLAKLAIFQSLSNVSRLDIKRQLLNAAINQYELPPARSRVSSCNDEVGRWVQGRHVCLTVGSGLKAASLEATEPLLPKG